MDSFFQHLLLNNRAPNPCEAQILSNLRAHEVDSLEQLMIQLQNANTTHSDALQAVEVAERELTYHKMRCQQAAQSKWALTTNIQSLAERILSYELILSPLRQLPDEVLSEVFLTVHASQVVEYDNAKITRIVDCPTTLSHVSNQWRRVAFTTPRLWSFVQIIASKWPFGSPLLNQYLTNSRFTHLRLCLEDMVHDTPIDNIFRFLRPHKARITDLQYRLEDRRESPFDFEDYLWAEYPFTTTTFRIIDHSVLGGAFGATLSLPHYNRVTRLSLLNVALEGLAFVHDPALAHLEVMEWKRSRKACGPCVTEDDIYALFSRATSLKRLFLENLDIESSILPMPRVETPHGLLQLSTQNVNHEILPSAHCIDFPHLQTLSSYGDRSFEACSTAYNFGPSVTTLSLFELKYFALDSDNHIDEWCNSFIRLQKLARLELLLDDYLFDVIMRSLTRATKRGPSNLPSLRVIHIDARSVTPGASLLEFVHKRKAVTESTQLESVVLGSPAVFEESVLRELTELVPVEFARFDPSLYILEDGKE